MIRKKAVIMGQQRTGTLGQGMVWAGTKGRSSCALAASSEQSTLALILVLTYVAMLWNIYK
jgi:hypothetical protein